MQLSYIIEQNIQLVGGGIFKNSGQ